ncbi:hypothetical protein [Streptomyces roseolilacinus]|uniref:hypothetical protein n=1 Tax=Streptomyces roseolilacinus TaxID=66904 RepID=UPI00380AE82D
MAEYDYFAQYPNEGPDHSPDCTQCAAARSELERIRDHALTQRERFADQVAYPYVAGSTALHRSGCSTVEHISRYGQGLSWGDPSVPEASEAEVFEGELLGFAHAQVLSAYGQNFTVMTTQETVEWIRGRTGPRGGTKLRLCKICTPEVPEGARTGVSS